MALTTYVEAIRQGIWKRWRRTSVCSSSERCRHLRRRLQSHRRHALKSSGNGGSSIRLFPNPLSSVPQSAPPSWECGRLRKCSSPTSFPARSIRSQTSPPNADIAGAPACRLLFADQAAAAFTEAPSIRRIPKCISSIRPPQGGLSIDGVRCKRAHQGGDPRSGSRDLFRTQVSLPACERRTATDDFVVPSAKRPFEDRAPTSAS